MGAQQKDVLPEKEQMMQPFGEMSNRERVHERVHMHTQTKAVLNRMSRIIGHMESIRAMMESGRSNGEILVQLSAVRAAVQGLGKVILKNHIEHCIVDAVREDDQETMEKLTKAIDQFIR